jgi:hypothetical protein
LPNFSTFSRPFFKALVNAVAATNASSALDDRALAAELSRELDASLPAVLAQLDKVKQKVAEEGVTPSRAELEVNFLLFIFIFAIF